MNNDGDGIEPIAPPRRRSFRSKTKKVAIMEASPKTSIQLKKNVKPAKPKPPAKPSIPQRPALPQGQISNERKTQKPPVPHKTQQNNAIDPQKVEVTNSECGNIKLENKTTLRDEQVPKGTNLENQETKETSNSKITLPQENAVKGELVNKNANIPKPKPRPRVTRPKPAPRKPSLPSDSLDLSGSKSHVMNEKNTDEVDSVCQTKDDKLTLNLKPFDLKHKRSISLSSLTELIKNLKTTSMNVNLCSETRCYSEGDFTISKTNKNLKRICSMREKYDCDLGVAFEKFKKEKQDLDAIRRKTAKKQLQAKHCGYENVEQPLKELAVGLDNCILSSPRKSRASWNVEITTSVVHSDDAIKNDQAVAAKPYKPVPEVPFMGLRQSPRQGFHSSDPSHGMNLHDSSNSDNSTDKNIYSSPSIAEELDCRNSSYRLCFSPSDTTPVTSPRDSTFSPPAADTDSFAPNHPLSPLYEPSQEDLYTAPPSNQPLAGSDHDNFTVEGNVMEDIYTSPPSNQPVLLYNLTNASKDDDIYTDTPSNRPAFEQNEDFYTSPPSNRPLDNFQPHQRGGIDLTADTTYECPKLVADKRMSTNSTGYLQPVDALIMYESPPPQSLSAGSVEESAMQRPQTLNLMTSRVLPDTTNVTLPQQTYDSPRFEVTGEFSERMHSRLKQSPSTATYEDVDDPPARSPVKQTRTKQAKHCGYEEIGIKTPTVEKRKSTPPPRPPLPRSLSMRSQKSNHTPEEKQRSATHCDVLINNNTDVTDDKKLLARSSSSSSDYYSRINNISRTPQSSIKLDSPLDSPSSSGSDNETLPKDETKKSKLFSISKEILTTERSFVHALELICEDFGEKVKNAMARNSKFLPEGVYSTVFMNIEQIYELDKKFLQDLEERMQKWDDHKRIGDVIRAYGHFLKMYVVYIKGYDNAMSIFHECLKTNLKFATLVKEFESGEGKMNLSSYLLKPIQRIPSYRLLLKEYLKHLPRDSIDYEDISDGVEIVSEVANHINESMKEGEKFQEVLRIQSLIVNSKDIVKPGRYLLKEGVLQKMSRKDLQQRTFILFTDALFYCMSLGHNQLKLILELPLVGMMIEVPDSQDLTHEFRIIGTKRSFILKAESHKHREDWVETLQQAIDVANKRMGTFTLKRDEANSNQIELELGDQAPPWIPDGRVTMCQVCASGFTLYKRRHHCRACGKVVCKGCSSYEAPLKFMDYEPARVCKECYKHLLDKLNTNSNSQEQYSLKAKFKEHSRTSVKNRISVLPTKYTEVAAQEYGIENSGFLKITTKSKKEKRCWFVLKDRVLYTYKASSDPAATGTTPILGYTVDVSGNWDREEFAFKLSHPGLDEITFKAENRTSAERWLHCLMKASDITT